MRIPSRFSSDFSCSVAHFKVYENATKVLSLVQAHVQTPRQCVRRHEKHSAAIPRYVKAHYQDTVPLTNPMPPTDPILLTDPITISHIAPHRDAIIGTATIACTLSSAAITARALAENPESAIAMANALQRIKTTVTTVLTARGIPPNSATAATIWAAVLDSSIRKAREVVDRLDEPDLASQEAARLEGLLASGGADAIAIKYCRGKGLAVAI